MKLLSDSQDKIIAALKVSTNLSVDELTRKLRLTKTAVRRHILNLEKRGLLERVPGSEQLRGRPPLMVRLAPAASRLFPSKEAEILSELLRFLSQNGKEDLIEGFFESYWQKRYEEIQNLIDKKGKYDLDSRLSALKEVLEKEGFMPRLRFKKQGSELSLQECHCPLQAATQVTKLPCHLEKRLISRVLNAPVLSTTLRSEEKNQCEYILPIPPQNSRRP